MPDFRRYFVPGGTVFFTLVTGNRYPLFAPPTACRLLGQVLREVRQKKPFTTLAIVLLPDHLHVLWTLPEGDSDYPGRWKAVKAKFTSKWLSLGGREGPVSEGYLRQRRRGVWQPRYMEHTIEDEDDLHAHADYIHYNPVKHGYAQAPKEWRWSSFRRYVASGDYPENWGASGPPRDFGRVDERLLE